MKAKDLGRRAWESRVSYLKTCLHNSGDLPFDISLVYDSDEDDGDEQDKLLRGRSHDPVSTGLGFHSGFLDDDELHNVGTSTAAYHDYPDRGGSSHTKPLSPTPSSPSGSGSSWEHASAR